MSTGRPPIALGLIDDDLQSRCLRLRRRLTDAQAATFESFLSFRSVHLLTWLYRCFPSLEGQLARGALPAIMRCDPVIKLSPASIYRGQLFDKKRLWVCTDTHLLVFREDGALKVQVAIADISEIMHLRIAAPVNLSGEEDPGPKRIADSNNSDDLESNPQITFQSHRRTALCHALILRCPSKRDVGAFFGPSAISVNLLIQYIINRRRVAVVNYVIRTGSMNLPATATHEAVVTRPPEVLSPTALVQFLVNNGIQLKRPAGTASVSLSAPALPLVTAASAAVEVAIGSTVYQEALRELESNATRCREETADATCQLLMTAHMEYSSILRESLSLKRKTEEAASEFRALTEENANRQQVAFGKLQAARSETQRLASDMLAMADLHSKSVAAMRETCLTSEERAKKSLDDANMDDQRCRQVLEQLGNEGRFLEHNIAQQRERLAVLQATLPSLDNLQEAISHLKTSIASIQSEKKAVESSLREFATDTQLRTGLTIQTNFAPHSSSVLTARGASPIPDAVHAKNASMERMYFPSKDRSISNVSDGEDVKFLEEQALEALELKRNEIENLAKARIAHANESILLERKRARCEQLADAITASYQQQNALSSQIDALKREIELVQKRMKVMPLEALLCDDLKRAQVIEASVERSVRAGGSPAGLKSNEEVLQMQLSHLHAIKERMQSAVNRLDANF